MDPSRTGIDFSDAEHLEAIREAIILDRLPTSRGCFVCGAENPIGLKIHFHRTGDGVEAKVTPGLHFQGFDRVLQGGVVAGLMDDAMWYAILSACKAITMTVELNVRYKAPVPVETELTVTGKMVEQRRSLHTCEAAIIGPEGKVLAEATGKFITAPKNFSDQLAQQMV